MLGQPLLNFWMFVRGVVVCNQMQRFVLGRLAVYLPEKLQPLDVAMTLLALRNNLAIEHVECGKQRGPRVARVVACRGGGALFLPWYCGLGSVHGGQLAVVVAAQDA